MQGFFDEHNIIVSSKSLLGMILSSTRISYKNTSYYMYFLYDETIDCQMSFFWIETFFILAIVLIGLSDAHIVVMC